MKQRQKRQKRPAPAVWRAPYPLTPEQHELPEGQFLLPVCTNREHLLSLLTALANEYALAENKENFDYAYDVWEALAHIENPCAAQCHDCTDDCEDGCTEVSLQSGFITFEPQSPFVFNADPPAGYAEKPFFIQQAADNGLLPGDVLVRQNALGLNPIDAYLESGFPRFRIEWTYGRGELEIELLAVPLGGLAIISIDDGAEFIIKELQSYSLGDFLDPLGAILDIVLNQDAVDNIVVEIDFEDNAPHTVDVTFVPKITITDLISFGGGVRRVSICAQDVNMFRLRQNEFDTCLLEQSLDGGISWIPAFDYSLCANPAKANLDLLERYYPPDSPPPLPGEWDNQPGETPEQANRRDQALCFAVLVFLDNAITDVRNRAIAAGHISAGSTAVGLLALVAGGVFVAATGGLGAILVGLVALATGVAFTLHTTAQELTDALADEDALREIYCCMISNLRGNAANFDTFADSMDGCSLGTEAANLRLYLVEYLNWSNFLLFAQAASTAIEHMSDVVDFCLECGDTFCVLFEFSETSGNWVTMENGTFPAAQYTSGTGWVDQWETSTGERTVAIQKSFAERFIQRITIVYDSIPGTFSAGQEFGGIQVFRRLSGVQTNILNITTVQNVNQFTRVLTPLADADTIQIRLTCSNRVAGQDGGGSAVIRSVKIEGLGSVPTLDGSICEYLYPN